MSQQHLKSNKNDIAAVIDAALAYAFGVAAKDRSLIGEAFDVKKAQMKLITGEAPNEKVFALPIEDVWKKIWQTLPTPASHEVEIRSVAVHDGRLAVVHMINGDRFFDQLSLYKVNGTWRIYDKMSRLLDGSQIPEADLEALFGPQA